MFNVLNQLEIPTKPDTYKSQANFGNVLPKRPKPTVVRHHVKLLKPQHEFYTDRETRVLGFIGGVGTGKTFTLMRWAVDHMRSEAGTGTIGFIGANTHDQLHKVVLKELWAVFKQIGFEYGTHYIFNRKPPRSWNMPTAFDSHSGVLSVRYWGQAVCKSTTNYDALRGNEYGWLGLDEARDMPREAWDVLLARHRCTKARRLLARLSTTPNGFDWLWEYLEEEKAAKNISDLDRRIISMSTFENPYLSDAFLRSLFHSYSPQQIRQELLGHFVNVTAGQVYVAFDRFKNVANVPYAPGFPLVLCFDFNRTPYCVAIAQTDGERVNVIDEVVMEQATTFDVAARIKERWGQVHKDKEVYIYGDPMGQHQLSTTSHRTDYDIVQQVLGDVFKTKLRVKRQAPGILDRVNAVNAMLLNGNGERRLLVHPNCRTLIRDFEQVTWHPTTKGQLQKDKSTKHLTHMSDGVGYFIAERFPARVARGGRISL